MAADEGQAQKHKCRGDSDRAADALLSKRQKTGHLLGNVQPATRRSLRSVRPTEQAKEACTTYRAG